MPAKHNRSEATDLLALSGIGEGGTKCRVWRHNYEACDDEAPHILVAASMNACPTVLTDILVLINAVLYKSDDL